MEGVSVMTDDPNRRIGDYEVLGVLGAGGMGKVFKVRNVISDRVEAMKVLLPDLAGRQELADRFLREIKLLAGLDHPNIAQLRTALTLSNRLVMVMEYVEGTTIAARLEQAPVPPSEAVGYVIQVLNALAYAHGRNVIHRDIKPANMMVMPNGTVKLMDFGIARASNDASMTVTGTTLGSLYYMSPEQVKGSGVDARSDLYSLGVSLYEMVTGQTPFKATSDYSLMTAQLQERPKPPSELLPGLPPQLNGIILHAMAKEPGDRFQTADEFRQSLEAVRQSLPALAAQPIPVAPPVTAAPIMPTPVTVTSPAAASVLTGSTANAPTVTAPAFTPVAPQPEFAPVKPPQAAPSVMAMSPAPSKGRGLYITLGAVIVLVVLVLAGISLPRLLKTRANDQQQQQPSGQKSQDQSSPPSSGQSQSGQPSGQAPSGQTSDQSASGQSGSQSGSGSADANAGNGTGSTPQAQRDTSAQGQAAGGNAGGTDTSTASSDTGKHKGKKSKAKSSDAGTSSGSDLGSTTAGNQGSSSDSAADSGDSYEAVEQEVDEVSSRATSYNQSLDTMSRSMSSQGLNLRGDIVSAQELMKTNLDRAQQALNAHDTKNAKRYLSVAQAQMEKIEKFLGH